MLNSKDDKINYKVRVRNILTISNGKKLGVAERADKYHEIYGDYICKKCFSRPATYKMRLCADCREREIETYSRTKTKFSKNKELVLDYFGRVCACCGETMVEVLEVDHIDNDGAQHRKSLKKSSGKGGYMHTHLVETNFMDADKYQLLCANCNKAKAYHGRKREGYNGTCPHQEFLEDYNVMKELLQEQGLTSNQMEKEIRKWIKEEKWEDTYLLLKSRNKLQSII